MNQGQPFAGTSASHVELIRICVGINVSLIEMEISNVENKHDRTLTFKTFGLMERGENKLPS